MTAICKLEGCTNPVPPPKPGRGRPPSYCSPECRIRYSVNRQRDSGYNVKKGKERYAAGYHRRPCSMCGEPTGWPSHHGGENPICQPCRRKRALRICEQCKREFDAIGRLSARFCSNGCHYANMRKHEDPRSSSKASSRLRRARHAETWDGVEDRQIFERDNWTCLIPGCQRGPIQRDLAWPASLSPSIDHIVPLTLGGSDSAPNKRAAHLVCNISRGNRMHPDDVQIITPQLAPLGLLPAQCKRGHRRKPVRLPWPRRLYHRTCRWCGITVSSTKTSSWEFTVCTECSHGICTTCGVDMAIVVNSRPPETRQCHACRFAPWSPRWTVSARGS